mgnify:CR=1 FL=1
MPSPFFRRRGALSEAGLVLAGSKEYDTGTAAKKYSRTVIERLAFPDRLSESAIKTYSRTVIERLCTMDDLALSGQFNYSRMTTEVLLLGTTLQTVYDASYSRTIKDVMAMLSPSNSGEVIYYVFLQPEILSLTDEYVTGAAAKFSNTVRETLVSAEAFLKVWSINRSFADTFASIDGLSKRWAMQRQLTETIILVDAFSRAWNTSRTLTEAITLNDALSRVFSRVLLRAATETLVLTDISSTVFVRVLSRVVTEALAFIDRLTPTYWEGCLDYDYLLSVFNTLAKLAGGKSAARMTELVKDP